MKKIILLLTILLSTLLPARAVRNIEANPINVAVSLVEKTDSAKVASTLEYYGYAFQDTDEGYAVMKDSKGNEICYTFSENHIPSKYPTVIVKTHEPHKEIDSRLKELNFEKKKNGYEHMKNQYGRYKKQCLFGPKNTLIIRRVQNN